MSMKNPLTLAGIEPATFRIVAQHLNHCATAVPWVTRSGQNSFNKNSSDLNVVPSYCSSTQTSPKSRHLHRGTSFCMPYR